MLLASRLSKKGTAMNTATQEKVPGYTYGTASIERSPITLEAFTNMQRSVLFGPEDEQALRRAGEVLTDQIEAVLDVWYGFVGANPHLAEVEAMFNAWFKAVTLQAALWCAPYVAQADY
jgi:hypothetical protein